MEWWEKAIKNKMENKTKLKTLKEEYQAYGLDYDSRKIKAEAVKWIKDLPKAYYEENDVLRNWIKHFFNLTEEDLY